MTAVLINGSALAFASYAVNRNEARRNLRGIHIEHHEGHALCVATDGKIMLYARSDATCVPFEAFTLDYAQGQRLVYLCREGRADTVSLTPTPNSCWMVWMAFTSDKREVERGFIHTLEKEDGLFPDWRTVVPVTDQIERVSIPCEVDPGLLIRAARAVRAYSDTRWPITIRPQSYLKPAIIELAGQSNCGGLIMPMKAPSTIGKRAESPIPAWALRKEAIV